MDLVIFLGGQCEKRHLTCFLCCLFAYVLTRILRRVEDLLPGEYKKCGLSMHPASNSDTDVVESHCFAAFQYFSYQASNRRWVVAAIHKVCNGVLFVSGIPALTVSNIR